MQYFWIISMGRILAPQIAANEEAARTKWNDNHPQDRADLCFSAELNEHRRLIEPVLPEWMSCTLAPGIKVASNKKQVIERNEYGGTDTYQKAAGNDYSQFFHHRKNAVI